MKHNKRYTQERSKQQEKPTNNKRRLAITLSARALVSSSCCCVVRCVCAPLLPLLLCSLLLRCACNRNRSNGVLLANTEARFEQQTTLRHETMQIISSPTEPSFRLAVALVLFSLPVCLPTRIAPPPLLFRIIASATVCDSISLIHFTTTLAILAVLDAWRILVNTKQSRAQTQHKQSSLWKQIA